MPEQLLDGAEVGAALQQVRGEGMPQPVWMRDEPPQGRSVEPASTRREEERVLGASRELRSRLAHVARDEARRLFAERHDAVLAALAESNVHQFLLEVDVAQVETDGLGAAQACGVDELDECLVSERERPVAAERVDDVLDLALLGGIRQAARSLRGERSVWHSLRPEREPKERAHGGQLPPDRRRCEPAARPRAAELGDPVRQHADIDVFDWAVRPEPVGELAQIRGVDPARPVADSRRGEEPLRCGLEGHSMMFAASYRIACLMSDRWTRLADLCVHGANIQPGQIVLISAQLGQEELARSVAAAAYAGGAKFVDVSYFDPWIKRARIEHADPDTLDFVPEWYGGRMLAHAEEHGGRVTIEGIVAPHALDGLDMHLVGKDMLPRVRELSKIVADRSTNWCIVPCPHPEWGKLVYPELGGKEAYEKLWRELEHVLRLDEPDPVQAWEDRMNALNDSAGRLGELRFDAIEMRGPGT